MTQKSAKIAPPTTITLISMPIRSMISHGACPRSESHHIQSCGALIGAIYHISPFTGVCPWNSPKMFIPAFERNIPIIWMFACSTRTRIIGRTLA